MMTRPEAVRVLIERGADPTREADDGAIGNAVTAAFFAMNGVELRGEADHPDARTHAAAVEVLKRVVGPKVGLNFQARRRGRRFPLRIEWRSCACCSPPARAPIARAPMA